MAEPNYRSKRQRHELLRSQLFTERSTFINHYEVIQRFIRPRRARFSITDQNIGNRRNAAIINARATVASRILRSGMVTGNMNPARPWFALGVDDPLASQSDDETKRYCHDMVKIMSDIFLKSNLYQKAPILFGDGGDYGTGAMMMEEDFDTGVRFQDFAVGSYMLANDNRGQVRTFVRDFRLTVRQLIEEYADYDAAGNIIWDNFSQHTQVMWRNAQLDTWVNVCHCIEANQDYDPRKPLSKDKKFISSTWERGSSSGATDAPPLEPERYLRVKGYDYFPVITFRWEVADGDVYGTDCPGMTALGDIQQLQHGERQGMRALDKMVDPPIQAGPEFTNKNVSMLPGQLTVTSGREGSGIRAIHEINYRVDLQEQKQEKVGKRIDDVYMVDLWMQINNDDRNERATAEEIKEGKEERMIQIGPTLWSLNQDVLDPIVKNTYLMCKRQGRFDCLGPPPKALQGKNLKIEYVSILAQAQKLLGIDGLERYTNYVSSLASEFPETKDVFNADEALEIYAEATGVPPKINRSKDEVAAIRAKAQQAQAAEAQIAQAQAASSAAKNLAQSPMDSDNALSRLADVGNAGA